jgi:hypothetical protein
MRPIVLTLLLWPALSAVGLLNVEFKFTPFHGGTSPAVSGESARRCSPPVAYRALARHHSSRSRTRARGEHSLHAIKRL